MYTFFSRKLYIICTKHLEIEKKKWKKYSAGQKVVPSFGYERGGEIWRKSMKNFLMLLWLLFSPCVSWVAVVALSLSLFYLKWTHCNDENNFFLQLWYSFYIFIYQHSHKYLGHSIVFAHRWTTKWIYLLVSLPYHFSGFAKKWIIFILFHFFFHHLNHPLESRSCDLSVEYTDRQTHILTDTSIPLKVWYIRTEPNK